MSLEFFLAGLHGTRLTASERGMLSRGSESPQVILFGRNIESESQLADLVSEIRSVNAAVVLFVDQEGGSVDRFRAVVGSSISLRRAAAAGASRRAGLLAGELLAHFGIDVDLAPVVDRAVAGAGEGVLGERAAAEDPASVVDAAREFIEGLAESGVGSCLKHFPGLGRATLDSHLVLPPLAPDPVGRALDLRPFQELAPIVPAIMVSHGAARDSGLPATLDSRVIRDLTGEIGFPGAVVSDDLEMGALARFGSIPERSAACFAAGCDLLCVGKETSALPEAERRLRATAERIFEARARLGEMRRRLAELRAGRRPKTRPLAEIAAEIAELRESPRG